MVSELERVVNWGVLPKSLFSTKDLEIQTILTVVFIVQIQIG